VLRRGRCAVSTNVHVPAGRGKKPAILLPKTGGTKTLPGCREKRQSLKQSLHGSRRGFVNREKQEVHRKEERANGIAYVTSPTFRKGRGETKGNQGKQKSLDRGKPGVGNSVTVRRKPGKKGALPFKQKEGDVATDVEVREPRGGYCARAMKKKTFTERGALKSKSLLPRRKRKSGRRAENIKANKP